jgi:hypothetical protein
MVTSKKLAGWVGGWVGGWMDGWKGKPGEGLLTAIKNWNIETKKQTPKTKKVNVETKQFN